MSKWRYLYALSGNEFIPFKNLAVVFMVVFFCMIQTAAAKSCFPMNSAQLNFGNYNPGSSQDVDVVATVDIYCSPAFKGQQLDVRINLIGVSSQGERRVLNNRTYNDEAHFILFQDAARTIPLTDQMAIPITEYLPQSKIFTIRLYGRMPAKQDIGAGTYMTNLIIHIDY
jgi:spore coat protein U-like protein